MAEQIANAWNQKEIRYAVVHGLHGYPERLGRDLDIVIEPTHVSEAVRVAISEAKKAGFEQVLFRWSHWGLYQLALVDEGAGISLPIDLLCTTGVLRAKWVRMLDGATFSRIASGDGSEGPFRVSHEGTFLKACIRPLLCGDLSRFGKEYQLPVVFPSTVNKGQVLNLIGEYGEGLLKLTCKAALEKKFAGAVRKMQVEWCLRHPIGALISLYDAVVGRLKRRWANASDLVRIQTDNPEYIADVLNGLSENFKKMFVDLVCKKVEAPKRWQKIWGAIYLWRKPPVSEFMINAVVVEKHPKEKFNKYHEKAKKRKIPKISPDMDIEVYGDHDYDTLSKLFKESLFNLLSRKYTFTGLN